MFGDTKLQDKGGRLDADRISGAKDEMVCWTNWGRALHERAPRGLRHGGSQQAAVAASPVNVRAHAAQPRAAAASPAPGAIRALPPFDDSDRKFDPIPGEAPAAVAGFAVGGVGLRIGKCGEGSAALSLESGSGHAADGSARGLGGRHLSLTHGKRAKVVKSAVVVQPRNKQLPVKPIEAPHFRGDAP